MQSKALTLSGLRVLFLAWLHISTSQSLLGGLSEGIYSISPSPPPDCLKETKGELSSSCAMNIWIIYILYKLTALQCLQSLHHVGDSEWIRPFVLFRLDRLFYNTFINDADHTRTGRRRSDGRETAKRMKSNEQEWQELEESLYVLYVRLSSYFLNNRSSDRVPTWQTYCRGAEEVARWSVESKLLKLFGWALLKKAASSSSSSRNTADQTISPCSKQARCNRHTV